MVNKRDIYIRIQNIKEIVNVLDGIKKTESDIKKLLLEYDNVSMKEDRIFDSWGQYIESIDQKLDHIAL